MVLAADGGDLTQYADAWGIISKVGLGGGIAFLLFSVVSRRWFAPLWYVKELEGRLVTEAAAAEARAAAIRVDSDAERVRITAERDAALAGLAEQNEFYRTDVIPLLTRGIGVLADATREAEHRRWSSGGAGNGS